MASVINRFKEWNKARKMRRAQRIFAVLYKDPKSGMQEVVNAAGYRVGCNISMGMLDRLRIVHCHFCPEIAPLRNHPMGKMCEGHYKVVTRNPTQKQEEHEDAKMA